MTTYINNVKVLLAIFALGFVALIPLSFAHGAVDYFLKIDGVEGESTKSQSATPARVTATTTEQKAQFDAFLKIDGVDGETKKPGVEPDEIDVKATDDDSEAKGGNVEFEWKVEEGEKSMEEGRMEEKTMQASSSATSTAPKGGVSVAAGDVNGLTVEEKEQFLMTVKNHAQVQSGQDLENFAKGILLQDENVKEVAEEETKVSVKYKAGGKFLGFIPVSYTEEVSVETADTATDSDGLARIKVKLPWFSFLIKEAVTAEEIEEEVKKDGHEKWIELQSWSFGERAQIFTTLSNVLKAKHDTVKNSVNNVK